MMIEGSMDYGTPAITDSNTPTISPNVHDAGSAKRLHGGAKGSDLFFSFDVSADCTAAELKLVGASTEALDADEEVIASTGVLTTDKFGAPLGTGVQRIEGFLDLNGQKAAKQYYGLFLELGGTNPDATAGRAFVVIRSLSI